MKRMAEYEEMLEAFKRWIGGIARRSLASLVCIFRKTPTHYEVHISMESGTYKYEGVSEPIPNGVDVNELITGPGLKMKDGTTITGTR